MKPSWLHFAFLFLMACNQNNINRDNQSPTAAEDQFIDSLVSEMTLEEKIGQMTLLTSDWAVTGPTLREEYREDIRKGLAGNIFNALTVEYNRELQRLAVEETRLGIPLLFGYDIIHGYKTIFPIPLAEACSWDTTMIYESARLAAKEGAAAGVNWTFNPMVDISMDPRWGRIAEGAGEDPYLGSLIAAAKVNGYQDSDLSDPETMAACVKHFAAYGAPEGGRDYGTVDMSERRLRETFLPPYKAAVDAGVATVMTAFNELDGVPATGSKFLFKDILRDEWDFNGLVVTDYTAINEMVPHGFAMDLKHAGELALDAGIDMDMQGAVYYDFLKESVEEGTASIEKIDQAVIRVLRLKQRLGLFDDPYLYLDSARENRVILSSEMMEHALEAGKKSIVLLKNDPFIGQKLLPLSENINRIALIGPLADNQEDLLGTWHASGVIDSVVTVRQGLEQRFPNATIEVAQGAGFTGEDRSGFNEAIRIARNADLLIAAVGENYQQSGEAASRSEIGLPGVQQALMEELVATGKPVIALVMAGRPLVLDWIDQNVPAIVNAWHLGTRMGDAVAAVLSGDYNPSGKLVVSFPRNAGQIPVYYYMKNTGRPFDPENKYTSKYLDVSNQPLYPFGYGLSYTTFEYDNLSLNSAEVGMDQLLEVSVSVKNTGEYAGEETVQLYTRDLVGSVTRPVKELKGFQKVYLEPGESEVVTFRLTSGDLKFYNQDLELVAEPGEFRVMTGGNSEELLEATFNLVEQGS